MLYTLGDAIPASEIDAMFARGETSGKGDLGMGAIPLKAAMVLGIGLGIAGLNTKKKSNRNLLLLAGGALAIPSAIVLENSTQGIF